MRRLTTAISAVALAFSMNLALVPAAAASGFDSAYAGESAFLTLTAGQTGTFTVFFANVGTSSWVRGTATQVDLAACLDDKITCNQQDASEAPFNPGGTTGWVSATRYASHTQTSIAPGNIGTFSYNVQVPSSATGVHHFNGALVVSATGADVHNEGYFQDVSVSSVSCTPTTITTTPANKQEIVGATHTQSATVTCANGAGAVGAEVTFAIQTPTNSLNQSLVLKAISDASGNASVTWSRSNPDVDSVSVFPSLFPAVRATATVQWVVQSVLTCSPTTSQTVLNNNSVIYTLTVKDPKTGQPLGAGNVISIGVQTAVTRGTATISTTNGTVAADLTTNANATAGKQINTVPTDANGNATFTVNGSGSTVTPQVWLEGTTLGGNGDTTLDSSEFQALCGAVTFANVNSATLTIASSMAGTQAQGAQRVYTVTAVDSSGNPANIDVNIGFVEALLNTQGTNAVVTWYDNGDRGNGTLVTLADLRTTAVTDPKRASTCDQVPNNTWDPTSTTGLPNQSGNTVTSASTPLNKAHFMTPLGKATFATCSATTDTYTPLAWQDVEATADRIPQNGEPQAQGSLTTVVATTLTNGAVIGFTGKTSNETDPTSASDVIARTKSGDGLEQFNFYMRNQAGNGFFTTTAQTVLWTVQNTGTANVYIVDFDGSASATTITVAPGTSQQVQSPIGASAAGCQNTGVDDPAGACHDSARIWLNAGSSATANITGSLLSGGASGTATKTWVVAQAEPTEPLGVNFTASGTVVSLSTTQKFYLLRTSSGVVYKITYATPSGCVGAGCTARHSSDTFIDRGNQVATCGPACPSTLTTWEGVLRVGDLITYTNNSFNAVPATPTTGNATHNITQLGP